jgi:hypothetical protein
MTKSHGGTLRRAKTGTWQEKESRFLSGKWRPNLSSGGMPKADREDDL